MEKQRKEILEGMILAMNTKVTPTVEYYDSYKSDREGYRHIDAITFDGFEYGGLKTKVFAYMGFPVTPSSAKVPAVVLIHGGGGHAFMDWVKQWNDRGYAAIAIDYNGYFPKDTDSVIYRSGDQIGEFVREPSADLVPDGYGIGPDRSYVTECTDVKDQWAYHAISQTIFAHNILIEDERVDSDNIGIVGISWGGVITTQTIGYDNRFSFAIPVYGHAYLGDERRAFTYFADPYVNALWAAERNLDKAKMPIFWLAYNYDSNFTVLQNSNSYKHTEGFNAKNVLSMIQGWEHSHNAVFDRDDTLLYADWVTYGQTGFVTFKTQPEGREFSCRIDIPEDYEGELEATLYYLTSPLTYTENVQDESWKLEKSSVTVDRENGVLFGTLPKAAKGYYVSIRQNIYGQDVYSSTTFVELNNKNE